MGLIQWGSGWPIFPSKGKYVNPFEGKLGEAHTPQVILLIHRRRVTDRTRLLISVTAP
jgi:hypothetical protein